MFLHALKKNQTVILFGASLALLLFLLKRLQLRFIIIDHAVEVYAGLIAVIFTGLGIWLALKLARPKTVMAEKPVYRPGIFQLNQDAVDSLNLSKREVEVLQLMAEGLSNHDIATRLFVSLSTVKTHSRNLFDKMGVGRRTHAIDKARKLGIIE